MAAARLTQPDQPLSGWEGAQGRSWRSGGGERYRKIY